MDNPEEANPEFSSDESFVDGEEGEEVSSDTDVDAKLAEEDVFDIEFFKCYSALKKKDDKIYDKDVRFFTEKDDSDDEHPEEAREDAKRPKMSLLDYHLNLKEEDIEAQDETSAPKSYYERELDEIKNSIKKIGEGIESDSDDDLLVVKDGSCKPRKPIHALLDKIEEDEDVNHLKKMWSEPDKLSEEDKFLRDYILNKRYIAPDQKGHFSTNLEDLSDVEEHEDTEKKAEAKSHSDEKDFDKIARVPRNATKTYRDLVEKREKKEKRLKKLEKEKKRKKALKEADCEDIVGDLPTKFHYRETEPNDYGLSAEELLTATDEELEQWIALKDAISYQDPDQELAQKKKFEAKRNDIELKKKIFKSIYSDEPEPSTTEPDNAEPQESEPQVESKSVKRKKKHKRGLNHKKFAKSGVAPDRLLAYGLSKNKLKKSRLL